MNGIKTKACLSDSGSTQDKQVVSRAPHSNCCSERGVRPGSVCDLCLQAAKSIAEKGSQEALCGRPHRPRGASRKLLPAAAASYWNNGMGRVVDTPVLREAPSTVPPLPQKKDGRRKQ